MWHMLLFLRSRVSICETRGTWIKQGNSVQRKSERFVVSDVTGLMLFAPVNKCSCLNILPLCPEGMKYYTLANHGIRRSLSQPNSDINQDPQFFFHKLAMGIIIIMGKLIAFGISGQLLFPCLAV